MTRAILSAGFLVFSAQSVDAAQSADRPAFEVASIRLHTSPLHTIMGLTLSGPRATLEGYNVFQLIMEAYHLKGAWQILPVPDGEGLESIYYDIIARAPGDHALIREEFRNMLQALLADRFKLSVHREMKEMPVYALVTANKGPKLKESAEEGQCSIHVGKVIGGQSYTFSGCPIDKLVDILGDSVVDRPVVDRTGLAGKYDFEMAAMPAFMSRNQPDPADLDPFTAIKDLGLKLDSTTAPVEMIAVDRVEKTPSENQAIGLSWSGLDV